MAREITGKSAGVPDFVHPGRWRIGEIRSEKGEHFTEAIAQNGVERENLTGLPTDRVIITGVKINSEQSLHYRVLFYATDDFDETDLDNDKLLGSVELDLTRYGNTTTISL